MKKMMTLVVALVLVAGLAAPALSEEATPAPALAATANGVVKAVDTYDVVAPFSGTLLPFALERGDDVQAGDVLFALDTTKVYAPEDGTVSLFAEVGDSAADVQQRYGALASIERASRYEIQATTKNSNNKVEYKDIRVGETLYFKQPSDSDVDGQGRVTAVQGTAYTVELTDGKTYEAGKQVKLFRKDDKKYDSAVGEGNFVRVADAAVQGTGRVVALHTQDGETVKKGDLLLETISADSDYGIREATVAAPVSGALETPAVVSGQQVYKGQLLVTLHDTANLKVVAEVDEVDLSRVQLGTEVTVTFDSYPGETARGTVTRISSTGTVKQNATYYDVDISFAAMVPVRLNMSATVTLP